jgi:ATP-binding cassette subfamily F protein uup
VLEGYLDTWTGTLVVASHDRFFLDRVCRQLWALEPDGTVREHVGGWTAYRAHRAGAQATAPRQSAATPDPPRGRGRGRRDARLSYNEQRQLKVLEREMPRLEARRDQLNQDLLAVAGDHVRAGELAGALDAVMSELDRAETQWLELHVRDERANQEQ